MATDWTHIKLEYINGSMSMRELATKHGINPAGLFRRAANEKWDEERKQKSAKVSEASQTLIEASRAEELAKFNEDDLKLARAIRANVAKHLNDAQLSQTKIAPNVVRALAGAAETAQRIGRLALGVPTNNTGISNPDGSPLNPPSFVVDWGDDDDANSAAE